MDNFITLAHGSGGKHISKTNTLRGKIPLF